MFSPRSIILALLGIFALYRFARFSTSHDEAPSRQVFEHPIPKLMAEAEAKYQALLDKQSKSLEDAIVEYRRRYKREPPKGFDDWYEFAVGNDVKIIDEYDSMMEDLEPFWNLPGDEFRRRVQQVRFLAFVMC